jgi:DNA-binding transcriptional LysR family regulator
MSVGHAQGCVKFISPITVIPAMNEFLATGPFDLYELQLFHLVAEHQSFTRAGRAAGLTQSAITRQIRGMEERLGTSLFERTTRYVRLTPAGAALHARSGAILNEVNDAIKPKFTRDLIVVVRRRPRLPHTLSGFVQNILFS